MAALILSYALKYRMQLALALLAAVVVLTARHHWIGEGIDRQKRADAAAMERARKAIVQREAMATQVSAEAASKLTKAQAANHVHAQALHQKVTLYVPPAADARCVVNDGFVRAYDAAALGPTASLPAAAGGHEQAPSGVPLSEVLDTTIYDFGAAHDWRAEALAWRSWYSTQKAAWDARP